MITLADYWRNRDQTYATLLSTEIRANAARTVDLANKLLERASAAGFKPEKSPITGTLVASGWRPPAVNATTQGAAPNSKHITGHAIDIYDPHGDLDDWLMTDAGQQALTELGLWMEHPASTKGWCHMQTIPPNSKRRVFYP